MFSILASNAKTSRSNKTGTWRSFKMPKYLKVNCIACGLCKLVCPEACVSGKEKNTFDADYLYCKGCGLCAHICPKKDIEMIKEDK